jgi:hypothetical protein
MGHPAFVCGAVKLGLGRGLGQHKLFQAVLVAGQIRLSGWKFVEAENISQQIGGLRASERSRGGGRHQLLDHVIDVDRGLALVFREEIIPAERRIRTRAIQGRSVAGHTLLLVQCFAAVGLVSAVDAIRSRGGLAMEKLVGESGQEKAEAKYDGLFKRHPRLLLEEITLP